ncbi:MAG: hypothetical protein QXS81_04955 [Candidatus Micrarchaeaceae archaeon]
MTPQKGIKKKQTLSPSFKALFISLPTILYVFLNYTIFLALGLSLLQTLALTLFTGLIMAMAMWGSLKHWQSQIR